MKLLFQLMMFFFFITTALADEYREATINQNALDYINQKAEYNQDHSDMSWKEKLSPELQFIANIAEEAQVSVSKIYNSKNVLLRSNNKINQGTKNYLELKGFTLGKTITDRQVDNKQISIIVQYVGEMPPIINENNVAIEGVNEKYKFMTLTTSGGFSSEFLSRLAKNPQIKAIETNFEGRLEDMMPNDPYLTKEGGWWVKNINAANAWNKQNTSNNVVIAIVDSGVDVAHEDLVDNILTNNAGEKGITITGPSSQDRIPNAIDKVGHGTKVAGIAGAVGNNGKGTSGIDWSVKILPIRITDDYGKGIRLDKIINAFDYAAQANVDIINVSLTLPWSDFRLSVWNQIKPKLKNIVIVAAAGNEDFQDSGGKDIDISRVFPASLSVTEPNIISVLATDFNDLPLSSSNYGSKSVHLGAPGSGIITTAIGNDYKPVKGTSFSCALVSGALALIKSNHNINKQPEQLIIEVTNKTKKNNSLNGKTISGGQLDLSFF